MKTIHTMLVLLLLLLAHSSADASQCAAIFPDGASTHSADGTIFFGYNSRLIGSDDNLLATTSIAKNGGSTLNTCNTADCVATGTPSEPASSINFLTTVSTTDVTLGFQDEVEIGGIDFPGNEFNNINPGSASEASIVFSNTHSEYLVNRMVLGFQNTLYLQAGATYWFNELSLGSQADIRVLGTGTATIYVNQSTSFPSPALINSPVNNSSGDASKLVMYVFSDVTFNNNSTFSGSLYLKGDLILGSSSYAFGAVSAASIELGTESTITYQSEEIAETDFGAICSNTVTPLAEYRFEESDWDGTADEIIDNTGNGHHGQVLSNSTPEFFTPALTGNLGTCGYANQNDGVIQITGLPLDATTNNVKTTVTFWMNWDGTNSTMPIGWDTHDIWIVSGSIGFNTGNGDVFGTSSAGLANGWHHIAVEFTNGSVTSNRMHIDGVEQVLTQRQSSPNNGNAYVDSELRIGGWSRGANYNFYGLIDEVRVYESSLSTSEIITIMDERHPCPPRPIVEYHFDEFNWYGANEEVIDSSGYAYDATPYNSINTNDSNPVIEGNPGTCHYGQFDGVDDYVQLPSSFPDLTESLTITAWINAADLNSGSRIFIDDQNNSQGFGFSLGDGGPGKLRFFSRAVNPVIVDTQNAVISENNWYFVAAVHDVTTKSVMIYVNGVALPLSTGGADNTISTYTGTWGFDTGPASIGGETDNSSESGPSFHFNGAIDEPRIYSTALSAAEISTIMNETRTCPTPPTLLLEYRLEEESWDGTPNEILDNSGNAHHARVNANSTPEIASPALVGIPGTCGYASQNDGVIEVTGLPLDSTTNDVKTTVTFWMNWDGTDNTMPIGWYSHDIWLVSGAIGFNTGNSDVYGVSSAGLANGWHHIAVEFTNGSVTKNRIHIDGVKQTLSQQRGSPNNSRAFVDSELRIGGWSRDANYNFHGLVDEVRVYQGVLSTPEVVNIMNERHECAAFAPDHFEIQHDGQGFTCEAESLTIKACADENCDTLYNQETAITLTPSGWSGGDTLIFTGELTTSLNVTDESTVTMAKISANPDAELRCFNGAIETCDITFSNDGFEIYGANIGDPVPDQVAANNFLNANVRAVRSIDNVCEALLEGTQEITLSYNCDTPDQCLTPLNDINIVGDGTGENSGNITVEFDAQGVASLALLNYPDAGRLTLSVAAQIEGVTFDNSDQEPVDVYPSHLNLTVAETELIYGGTGNQNNYVAGENFTFVIGAYGSNDQLLPNYQAENPQLKVQRVSPSSAGENGIFKYSDTGTSMTSTSATFNDTSGLSFSGGEHRYALANYTEVGRIEIDVQDANYLGNEIAFNGVLTLGDFYPAYFNVALTEIPTLADTCNNTFSYLGQNISFETPPEFTITAYNALGDKTFNYSDSYWNYQPDKPTAANLSFIDSSSYAADNSASVINLGDTPVVANNANYDASGTITINNGEFKYNKINPSDNSVFAAVSPFDAAITLSFVSDFFTSSFMDQNGNQDTICYQADHTDNTCLGMEIADITGTQIRYGRLTLESTYGPETEPLNVPIKAEYFDNNQWLTNTQDNCTNIDFTQAGGEIQLSDSSLALLVGSVTSEGSLLLGRPVGNQFRLDAPATSGELILWLNPEDEDVTWPGYLNYDWNGDGFIDANDFPEATITFGLFRGNDKIIHWREVFN